MRKTRVRRNDGGELSVPTGHPFVQDGWRRGGPLQFDGADDSAVRYDIPL